MCNTICFSAVKMDARTRLNVTLYVHCLSCVSLSQYFTLSHSTVLQLYTCLSAYIYTNRLRPWRSLNHISSWRLQVRKCIVMWDVRCLCSIIRYFWMKR